MARRQLTIDNDVAAELAGSGDSVLRKLEDKLDCDVFLRGNVITLDGPDDSVSEGQDLVELTHRSASPASSVVPSTTEPMVTP